MYGGTDVSTADLTGYGYSCDGSRTCDIRDGL